MQEKKLYENWNEFNLDTCVPLDDIVKIIMRRCGGDSFEFANTLRKTPEGKFPLFDIYCHERVAQNGEKPLTEWQKYGVSKIKYFIDPDIRCIDYKQAKTNKFWVSHGAGLTDKDVEDIIQQEFNIKYLNETLDTSTE